jgi:fission process protein 1
MSSTDSSLAKAAQVKVDVLVDKNANSTDSDVRYMAYGARLRTALRAGTRYVAYVSFHPCTTLVRVKD